MKFVVLITIFALELSPGVSFAQVDDKLLVTTEISAAVSVTKTVTFVETNFGNHVIKSPLVIEDSDESDSVVAILIVDSKAPRLRLKCRTAAVKKIEDRKYAITEPGEHLVEILGIGLIDGELFFEETEIRVKVGKGPNPPPDPDNVKNEYGVGLVAISAANFDQRNAKRIASIYRQSADFLFGKPTLKYLTSATDPNSRNPTNQSLPGRTSNFSWSKPTLASGARQFMPPSLNHKAVVVLLHAKIGTTHY